MRGLKTGGVKDKDKKGKEHVAETIFIKLWNFFYVLPNFVFTKIETIRDYYL